MEIPSKISYEFLLVVIGVFIIATPIYYELYSIDIGLSGFLILIGAFTFILGLSEIKYNYDIDLEIKEFEYAKQKNEYLKYFEKQNLLTKNRKNEILKDIKELLN